VLRVLIFLAIVLGIVGAVHFYFWVRLVRDTQLPFPYRPWASGILVALAALLPLPFLLARRLPPEWARWLLWPAFIWMGLMFLLFVLLVATDLIRLLAVTFARAGVTPELDPVRRTFLARVLGGVAGVGAGAVGVAAIGQGLRHPEVREVEVRLDRLPRECHGTTIVQLTDLHIGAILNRSFVQEIVARTNALEPDLVAITGDLVDGSVEGLWPAVEPLGELRSKHGVFFVTGNHEYFSGVRPWMEALGRLHIRVLANERVSIGEGPAGFYLAGVHDYGAARLDEEHRCDPARALAGRDPSREVILLAHQPKSVVAAARLGVGLQLSGHTHGGQLWPFNFIVRLVQPYVVGLHRHGETQIYVSPGTGFWGPPMRLGTRAEITRIKLLSTRPA
jgi:predicted MPP superfamily phosphohydrolase